MSETLMAVCSTPSSPLRVALPDDAATLLKFLLTVTQKQMDESLDQEDLIQTADMTLLKELRMYLW